MVKDICMAGEYKPYGKPFIMFAEILGTPEYKTEYPEYEKFFSTDDYVWRCTQSSINEEYAPENIQDFIADTNLKNSDMEINMTFKWQFKKGGETKYGIMTFIDEDEYLWNNFFNDNKYIYVDEDFYYKNCIEEFDIFIYHKTLKLIYKININYKGNIEIESKCRYPYEFESTEEAAKKFLEYISENYEGYKEESPIQGPTLGDKNQFTDD